MAEGLRFCPYCGSQLLTDVQQFCAICGHRLPPAVDGPGTAAATATPPVGAGALSGAAPDLSSVAAESMSLPPVAGPTEPAVEVTGPVAADRLTAGAAGVKQGPAGPPMSVPELPTKLATSEDDEKVTRPQEQPSLNAASTATTPQELLIAAGCAAGALIATAMPWANRILAPSVAGLQLAFPLIPPVAGLLVCWQLHSSMPKSLTTGRIWGLRISLALGLVAGVLVLAAFGQTQTSFGYSYNVSDVAQPAIGLWLYLIACGAGLVFAFRLRRPTIA